MRATVYPILLALAALPLVQNGAAEAAGADIVVRGRQGGGTIPPKSARGQGDVVSIVGEGLTETEFRTVDEIATAVASGQEGGPNGEVAVRVTPMPGRGGMQALRDVLTRPDVDFGIAPLLLLEKAATEPGMGNLRRRIDYVAPLYVEEIHLVAGPGIRTVEDLDGKTVSVGEDGGANEFLAREVLNGLGVKANSANLGPREAVAAVRAGKVAAAFVASGKPVDVLRGVSAGDGLHVVPLPVERIPEGFLPTRLTHADYPGLVPDGTEVATYGAQNVLFGYDWPLKSARGKLGATFLAILLYRLPELQVGANHPKWREVNVAATIPGWRRLPAMEAWLAKAKPRKDDKDAKPDEADFEAFLKRTGTQVTPENREALLQDFQRWRGAPVAGR